MTDAWIYDVSDEAGTERLGQALGGVLLGGSVVALCGTLGAGKTRLVQAVAVACGVDRRDVVSPTFVLVHEYPGSRPIYHLDAYRLRDEDEFAQLGADEYFTPPNLVFIEWADRVAACLPRERLEIAITVGADEGRRFEITARGERYVRMVKQLRLAMSGPRHD
ncbi:MAG TPA: tRNA (adenosine(37)-N6)-threonylcarbamoyltransferase complex ATPase subunit type 1 TsaE [Pirellulales bacterium]|nr:tRNA (adenosine(37)-N6)-threonylcarbamoyltransferase complex ATPase subunit type 1 TsaE [Pirellulales bacterium]